jgi:dihydroxy-acid dehydratase
MSGTAFGTIVLHISPEAAEGGPLSIVRTGDMISLDVEKREISIELSDEEINQRLKAIPKVDSLNLRGYRKLYIDTVTQADEGCDFDFMIPELKRTTPVIK